MVRLFLLLCLLAQPLWAEGNLSLTIRADEGALRPIVGEMVNVTIRGVYDRKVAVEDLEIDPSDAFDWIQSRPDNWHDEWIDGKNWIIFERHLSIWPKRAGPLHFGPARHRMTVIDTSSQRQNVVVTAKPLALSVGEFPPRRGWHLTARAVELTDHVSTDAARLADGETAVRTVTLRVLGALPEHLPPRPVVSENWLITFAAPVVRNLTLTAEGPVAEAVWTWQFRPHTGEPGVLEPVRIPYYDTTHREMAFVEIPALAIGYASFFTGQVPTGRIGHAQIWLLVGVMGAAAGLGLGLAMIRMRPEATARGWARLRRRWSPVLRFRLWQARRRGDFLALRRAATEAGWPAARLADIDRRLYGRPEAGRAGRAENPRVP